MKNIEEEKKEEEVEDEKKIRKDKSKINKKRRKIEEYEEEEKEEEEEEEEEEEDIRVRYHSYGKLIVVLLMFLLIFRVSYFHSCPLFLSSHLSFRILPSTFLSIYFFFPHVPLFPTSVFPPFFPSFPSGRRWPSG